MKLEFCNVTKQYGKKKALDRFDYCFTPGVYGLLGPNGAGKSTIMNLIVGNLTPTSGTITCDGTEIGSLGSEYKKKIGYMPQKAGYYADFTLEHFLTYIAALKGIPQKEAETEIAENVEAVNLTHVMKQKLGSFSGGMLQRAMLAQAMLGKPEIIILDEPTAGLDPKERIRIRNLISKIAINQIVIIATHVVADVAFIAKEILLLNQGRIVDSGEPYVLCSKIDGKVYELTCKNEDIAGLQERYKVSNLSGTGNGAAVRIISDSEPEGYECKKMQPDLEDLYLWLFD